MPIQRPYPGPRLETLASHSDPSVPLVSVYTPSRRPIPDPDDPDDPSDTDAVPTEPRPRPSLQVYYTAPLTTPNELETIARTLETTVLKDRFNTSGANYERLDVYSLPPATTTTDSGEEAVKDGLFATLAEANTAVQRCVAHQRAEIAARENIGKDKDWYIQRYDVPNGEWRRAIVLVRTPVTEWEWGRRDKTEGGMVLSTVMFDHTRDGPDQVCVSSGSTEGDIWTLIHELRHELNWQHSFVQFLD